MTEETEVEASGAMLGTVQPKLQPFNGEEAELWFITADCQFETEVPKITSSITKYRYAIMAIPPKIQHQVKDIMAETPDEPYKALRERLCAVYQLLQAEITSQVLNTPTLGDSTALALAASMLHICQPTSRRAS